MPNDASALIRLRGVTRTYAPDGQAAVPALRGIDLDVARGEFAAVTGPSGCGKTTLLHLLGALDTPTEGEVWVDDVPLHEAGERERTRYRREVVGIVFQFFNLMPTLTVRENVTLPLLLQGGRESEAAGRADELLDLVGLSARRGHFPHQLSGGEMQRTAIARALVHRPRLLVADEPTGNLDRSNADRVLDVLRRVHEDGVATLVVVTHSDEVAAAARRRIAMEDGRILAPIPVA